MLKLFRSQKQSVLGIDIGSAAVKIIELSRCNGQYCVEEYGVVPLSTPIMARDLAHNIDTVANSIKSLLSSSNFSSKYAAIALPDSMVIRHIMQINTGLNAEDLEAVVLLELEQIIPYPVAAMVFDYTILGPTTDDPQIINVLIVAAHQETVHKRVEILTRAELYPQLVDVESYAVAKAYLNCQHAHTKLRAWSKFPAGESARLSVEQYRAAYIELCQPRITENRLPCPSEEDFAQAPTAILDLGAVYIKFYVICADKLIFFHEEQLDKESPHNAIIHSNDHILLQTQRIMQLFFTKTHHCTFDALQVIGGLAKESNIVHILQENLSMPLLVMNPFSQMQIGAALRYDNLVHRAAELSCACGIAARAIEFTTC